MAETPQQLLDEIREVLGPQLCGLSDDDRYESLDFAAQQMWEYMNRIRVITDSEYARRILAAVEQYAKDHPEIDEETDDGNDTEP